MNAPARPNPTHYAFLTVLGVGLACGFVGLQVGLATDSGLIAAAIALGAPALLALAMPARRLAALGACVGALTLSLLLVAGGGFN